MSYKVIITYRDGSGKENSESVSLTALTEKDANTQCHFNREYAEKKHGKANIISIELKKKGA